MQLSRLTTAVALASALSVPALSSPAYAATLSTTYHAITGFSPATANGNTGDVVQVTNASGTVVVFKASWETAPRVIQPNTTASFSAMSLATGEITAFGTGVAGSVYVIL